MHYWNVQDLDDTSRTCGHHHRSEAYAWECLGRQTNPDAWGVYQHLETPEGHRQALAGGPWSAVVER